MLCTGHVAHLNPTKFLLIEIIFNFQESKLYGVFAQSCVLLAANTRHLTDPGSSKNSFVTACLHFTMFCHSQNQNPQLFGADGVSDLCVGRTK